MTEILGKTMNSQYIRYTGLRLLTTLLMAVMTVASYGQQTLSSSESFSESSLSATDSTEMDRESHTAKIIDYLRKARIFNLYNPQEKVYLHFDNTGYFKGETIRFKAYVTRCDDGRKTDLSRVLYVELINPSGDVVEHRKLKIEDGEAEGDIKVDSLQTTGFYEVRAYTRYMTNWGTHACFSRVFPIFKQPRHEGDYSRMEIDEMSRGKRLPNTRVDDEGIVVDTYRHLTSVKFYPEGGDLVNGLKSRVAFTVTNEDGSHRQTHGAIVDEKGTRVCDISTDKTGSGLFTFTPETGHTYHAVLASDGDDDDKKKQTNKTEKLKDINNERYAVPVAKDDGTVLTLDMLGEIDIEATLYNSPGMQGRLLAYALMHNGTVIECDTLTARREHHLTFNRFIQPEGVNQLTIFDSDGQILAERLFFICPTPLEEDSIVITSTTTTLTPCCKVSFKLQTEPNSTISFSAMDAGSMTGGWQGNMKTWMLLSSEVRGYIPDPEYYFEADDDEHRRAADMLMMIQGWRRYDFQLMAGVTEMEHRQPIEDRLYLFGQVKSKQKRYSADDVEITAYMYNEQGQVIDGKLKTDSLGFYNYIVPDIEGEWTLQMVSKKDDVERNYYIGIDRHFSPEKRYLYPGETQRLPIGEPNFAPKVTPDDDDDDEGDNNDDGEHISITKKTHLLPTVKIRTRRILGELNSTWYDEELAQHSSVIRYNCDEDADRYGDMGEDMPHFFEWLAQKNPLFEYDVIPEEDPQRTGPVFIDDNISYNNRPIIWIVNNRFWGITNIQQYQRSRIEIHDNSNLTGVVMLPDMLDVAKTLYISEDLQAVQQHVYATGLEHINPIVFYVYEHPLFGFKQKGLRRTHFEGYNVPTAFEMEDYSVMPPTEDFRRTLFWDANVKTDNRGRATVEFYNNSSCKAMYISAEGMTENGRIIINQ